MVNEKLEYNAFFYLLSNRDHLIALQLMQTRIFQYFVRRCRYAKFHDDKEVAKEWDM